MPTIPHNRKIHTQLVVGRTDGQTWEDISSYLERAEIELGNMDEVGTGNQGGDSVVRTLNFTVRNDRAQVPIYDDTLAREETEVVGQDTTVIGDETDSITSFINLLFNTQEELKGNTFHPRDKTSDWNKFNGSYAPLLWPMREVVLRVAIQSRPAYTQESGTTQKINYPVGTGDGTQKTFSLGHKPILPSSEELYLDGELMTRNVDYTIDYNTGEVITSVSGTITSNYTYYRDLFAGYLGDSIKSSDNGAKITCECRDYAKRLQRMYIDTSKTYSGPAEDVIQNILNDNGLSDISLYTPVSPGFQITEYAIEYLSVWDAVQNIATQIGWFLGFLYDESTNRFRLTLLEPPRTKDTNSADVTLTAEDDYYTANLDIYDTDIRNKVKVTYRDSNTGERLSVTVYDQASIDEYGLQAMQIEEADTSLIDTKEEALNFANAALSDLKDLTGTTYIKMPLFLDVDLYSGINVVDRRISSTTDFYGVDNVRHIIEIGPDRPLRTEVTGSGKVTGAHTKWLRMETRPGAGKPISFPEQSKNAPPPDVKKFVVSQDGAGLLFTWKPIIVEPVTYQIRRGATWASGQIIAESIQNDTYRTKQILKGTHTYHIKAIDAFGNESINSAESTVTVNFLPGVVDVVTHDELIEIDGTMNNVVEIVDRKEIAIAHLYSASDISTPIQDIDSSITIGEPTITGEGTYETQPVDLGGKIKVYAITNLSGTNENATSRVLEISYSDDNITYSDWELFNGGVYEARYFKFRVTLVSSGNQNIVNTFEIELDAPEFTQRDSNVQIDVGGTTIVFPESFNTVPSIMLTVIGDANPRLISQSKTQFTAKVIDDAGNDIGGTINWTATGY